MPPLRDKDLTCWYWSERGNCMFSERACLYSHYHTGLLADKHRSKAARGERQVAQVRDKVVSNELVSSPAATAAGRNAAHSGLGKESSSPNRSRAPSGFQSGHTSYAVPSQGMVHTQPHGSPSARSRKNSSNLASGVQPHPSHVNYSGQQFLPPGQDYQYQQATSAWSGEGKGNSGYFMPSYQSAHVRRMSNLNPNAQAFKASPLVGASQPLRNMSNFGTNTLDTAAVAEKRPGNALDINVDEFAMESLDRKGKGRALSSSNSSKPNIGMQAPASYQTYEQRANRYTEVIQREIDTRPPRAIEMPNLFWRLGIRLPSKAFLPPLPPQVEELWVRRDTINRNLKGSQTWVKLFNEDVAHMRMSNDPQAEGYAKWGQPYIEQTVAVDIPRWTLEMSKVEGAMIACMKKLHG